MSHSLRKLAEASGPSAERYLCCGDRTVVLGELLRQTVLGGRAAALYGRSVLIAAADQVTTASALIELDGIAARFVICPPDLSPGHLPAIAAGVGADAIVTDVSTFRDAAGGLECIVPSKGRPQSVLPRKRHEPTEWILLTSGTTGIPKMVVHNLSTLTGAIAAAGAPPSEAPIWSTFYDVRRYGGLQILLRALIGGGSLLISDRRTSVQDFLKRAAETRITHISGTPTHWRRALMAPAARQISPRYVRLSGEIADQAVLDRLRDFYPEAIVAHAFASTEAGVAFEVRDGLAGFPASLVHQDNGSVELRVVDGSLRIRSKRTALSYLNGTHPLADQEGFVDTGDTVELRDGRYYFTGRRGGIVNIGGLKVHPEEVEEVINGHPDVEMSLVKARKNPITGFLLAADVLPRTRPEDPQASELLKNEIILACRRSLPAHKVPVAIRLVSNLDVGPSGKLVRSRA